MPGIIFIGISVETFFGCFIDLNTSGGEEWIELLSRLFPRPLGICYQRLFSYVTNEKAKK